MDSYMFKRNNEGIHIINLGKTWEKLMVAARIIAAIPNPADVLVSIAIPKGSLFSPIKLEILEDNREILGFAQACAEG